MRTKTTTLATLVTGGYKGIMIRLFNHWFSWRSIAGVLFDFSFLIVSLVITLMWINSGLPVNPKQVVAYAILFGFVMLAINALLGLYQRASIRPMTETRARAVLSIYLSIPIAYGLYALLPIAAVNRDLIHLSAMSAVFGMLVTRVSAAHAPAAKMLRRRILVFGTGQQALAVKRALDHSDPSDRKSVV
jgi:FlaA1/EpsC-like NDP-sugar epimerase